MGFNFLKGKMNQEIATWTFYILAIVTMLLQVDMWFKRNKFLRTIKGQAGPIVNFRGSSMEELGIMIQIVFPLKLDTAHTEPMEELRKSAVKASRYWIVSLLLTLILPILLFNLTTHQQSN